MASAATISVAANGGVALNIAISAATTSSAPISGQIPCAPLSGFASKLTSNATVLDDARCAVEGVVRARRQHGSALTFLDVECGESAPVQVVLDAARVSAASPLRGVALSLLARPGARLRFGGAPGRTRRGELSCFAAEAALLELPPEPAAVAKAVQLVVCGELTEAAAAAALRCEPSALAELAHAFEQADGDEQATQFQPAVRACAAALAGRAPRLRPPRLSGDELAEVGALRAEHAGAWPPTPEAALAPLDETTLGALHPARALPAGLGDAEAALRLKYVGEKKVPQLRWVLHQLHGLMRARARAGAPVRRVVDLGCGRADLSLLLARLHPHVRVLALDSNEAAVADARARAAAAHLDNVRFACGDAARLLPPRRGVDLVVALHACGGLSDVALRFAARCAASALVVSCCWNKHRRLCPPARWGVTPRAKEVLCRLAESSEPRACRPAREAVCSLRLRALERDVARAGCTARMEIKLFPEEYSKQNWVLCAAVDPRRAECEPCESVS